jgi:hypothetical protein
LAIRDILLFFNEEEFKKNMKRNFKKAEVKIMKRINYKGSAIEARM